MSAYMLSELGLRVLRSPSREEWALAFSRIPGGNYTQMYEYGQVWEEAVPGTRALRLIIKEGEQPIALLQGKYQARFLIAPRIVMGGVAAPGPLLQAGDVEDHERALALILAELDRLARANLILRGRIWWDGKSASGKAFEDAGYHLSRTVGIYAVDLSGGPESVWRRMKSNKRRKVRQAETHRVEVVEAKSEEEMVEFYRLHLQSAQRAHIGHCPLDEIRGFWRLLGPNGKARIFLAKWQGRPVAGALTIGCGTILSCPAAGSTPEGWEARPNDYLHWKIMEWASTNGYAEYRMGGIDPNPESSSYGVYRWKIEYGGRIQTMLNYDKTYMPTLGAIIDRLAYPLYKRSRDLVGKAVRRSS